MVARLAARLVTLRAWERIGFARLSDYSLECHGLSARSMRSLALVGTRLEASPELEDALISGALGWTKVRLLAQLPEEEPLEPWIAFAGGVTAERLSKEVRAVDRGAVEARAATDPSERSRLFEVRCTPEVRWKWVGARGAAARVAGRVLQVSEAAELLAAEALSALPFEEPTDDLPEGASEGTSWSRASESETDAPARRRQRLASGTCPPDSAPKRPPGGRRADATSARPTGSPVLPPDLEDLLKGLGAADAFAVHERFGHAHALERRLDARAGSLLALVWDRWVHRALGYATREAYVRERLGMDPTRARTLVRLERAAELSATFAQAHRTGTLSWVKASVLEPLVRADTLGRFVERWVVWAGQVTVRRLRDDVEHALALAETDPAAFGRDGGLPTEAAGDREIRAQTRPTEKTTEDSLGRGAGGAEADREIGASERTWERDLPGLQRHPGPTRRAPDETCWARFIGPAETVQLFHAVLCTVRRRIEQESGRLPTPGEALGVVLDHAFASWGAVDAKVAARHRVFARDGWRCAAPGCTSMQNLHDHHIRFRSAGGSDALENRVTLCAFHHLRGVHAGLLRCAGRAPDGLTWELGVRPGVSPLLAYRSGDLRVQPRAS